LGDHSTLSFVKQPLQRYWRAGEVQAALEAVQSAVIVSSGAGVDRSGPPNNRPHGVQYMQVKKSDFSLLVGTTKGASVSACVCT
jgi:hypothetical protein